MKRILFTHSYFLRFDPKQWRIMQPYAPLGTITAAALIRQEGYDVRLWDPMFANGIAGLRKEIADFKPDMLVIYDDGFNYLTKMCLTNMREAAFEMIGHAVTENIPVVISSSDAADHFEKYLDCGALAVIKGEGEITLKEVIRQYGEQQSLSSSLPGIIFRNQNNTIVTPPRQVMKSPGDLPLPAWDLVNMGVYREAWLKNHGYFSVNMTTTRGCPFHCNWCAKPIYGNRYNSRSPENVIEEIKLLVSRYRPDHLWFCDDIFGLKPGWVQHFSSLLKKEGIRIRYKIQSRVDLLLQEDTISALAGSGCETVWVGAESGSQEVLDAMEKGTTVAQIHQATSLLKNQGVKVAFFLQFGYPGETETDIDKTISMVKELLPDDIGISVSYPLPGTSFYEKVKSELTSKSNWTDSDDLSLMFANTFPAKYYKHLHRYTHKSYRIHQRLDKLRHSMLFSMTTPEHVAAMAYHLPGAWFHRMKMKQFKVATPPVMAAADINNVREAFDKMAPGYDVDFTFSTAGRLQREKIHEYISENINSNNYPKVLEVNCGTGEDALWLARKGYKVTATDISPEMINVASRKNNELKIPAPPRFMPMNFHDMGKVDDQPYDWIFSNFGGFNCSSPAELKQLAKQSSVILNEGGKLVAVIMGKKCLSEQLYWKLKRPGEKNRRLSKGAVEANLASVKFPVWYYSPSEFSEIFKPWFEVTGLNPVGFFIPPSWMNDKFSKYPLLVKSARVLDKVATRIPALADYSDHYIMELTRK